MKNKKVKKKNIRKTTRPVKKQKVIVRKVRYGRVVLFLIIISLFFYLLSHLIDLNIKNIYISGNNLISDYEIIEIAKLEDYPSIFYDLSFNIQNRLEQNIYIKKATVKKKFRKIEIVIEDNYPVLFNSNTGKTIFQNKKELNKELNVPILINYVPDTIMDEFIDKFTKLDITIINRISEIKYDPNNVDDERFLLTMNDGNYVYLTLGYFEKINSYVSIYLDIISKYGEKKGILYLDSGEYFKIK